MGRSASAITDDSHASTVDNGLRGGGALTGATGQARDSWRPVSFRNGFDQPAVGSGSDITSS